MKQALTFIIFLFGMLASLMFSGSVAALPLFSVTVEMDRLLYQSDEPAIITMNIRNHSGSPASFTVYDETGRDISYTTFQPIVVDQHGRTLESLVPHKMEQAAKSSVVDNCTTRTIILQPKESFQYRTDLKKLFRLEPDHQYRVRGFFFPDYNDDDSIVSDNQVSFTVKTKKHYAYQSGVINRFKPETYSRAIAPSEIVVLALRAEKDRDWKTLRKYVDIEKLLKSYTKFLREYEQADMVERQDIRSRFIRYLARNRYDYIMEFTVLREKVDADTAEVVVNVKRYGARKPENFTYTYTLALEASEDSTNRHWVITELDATVSRGM